MRFDPEAACHGEDPGLRGDGVKLKRVAMLAQHGVLEDFPGSRGVNDIGPVAEQKGDTDAAALRQFRGAAFAPRC